MADDDSWSDLNHDLLLLIMMRVGFFDYIALSGVCKSWRSIALTNWNRFMVTKEPMKLTMSTCFTEKSCYLEDYTRRKFKTTIPCSNGRDLLGVSCGYLIFYGRISHDFWLVNPFTRKKLHFPCYPFPESISRGCLDVRGILVFSPSMSGWVFVVTNTCTNVISFKLAGKQGRWKSISSNSKVRDLHFFKGKIYMINTFNHLWELRLNPEPTLTLLKMKNRVLPHSCFMVFVSSCERLYLGTHIEFKAIEIDFDKMKWVYAERTIGEYAVFSSEVFKSYAAIKPDTWAHPWTQYKRFNWIKIKDGCQSTSKLWYFPHECLYAHDSGMENCALLNFLKE